MEACMVLCTLICPRLFVLQSMEHPMVPDLEQMCQEHVCASINIHFLIWLWYVGEEVLCSLHYVTVLMPQVGGQLYGG